MQMGNEKELQTVAQFLAANRVAVFIVAYNAERFISQVLQRIPETVRKALAMIYVIDDSSKDNTQKVAIEASRDLGLKNFVALKTPVNRGYGGNQKLGFLYAIRQGYDYVILLHGDGQYAPEQIPNIIRCLAEKRPDAVFASRMIHPVAALKGGMPLYKWVGNQVLTALENRFLGTQLSEFHTGYRCYRVETLKQIPFEYNSDDFHFDTEIIIQLVATKSKIAEIPVPTFYGDEICHVNGWKYCWNCLKSVVKFRLVGLGLFYERNFDVSVNSGDNYKTKVAENTLHHHIVSRDWKKQSTVLELGANSGRISASIADAGNTVTAVDLVAPSEAGKAKSLALDLNQDFSERFGARKFDSVVALDLIEHLDSPEIAIQRIFKVLKRGGTLYASTGNVGFFIVRFALLFGQFNYGKRGVLDRTHKRLFTIYTFNKLIEQHGFRVKAMHPFGPPIRDMVGDSLVLKVVDKIAYGLARFWPGLFAFNFLIEAERMEGVDEVFALTFQDVLGGISPTEKDDLLAFRNGIAPPMPSELAL